MLTDDRVRLFAGLFRRAWRMANMQMQDAAREAARDHGQFTREIDGVQGAFAKVCYSQPTEFYQWLGILLLETFGLPAQVQTGQQVQEHLQLPFDERGAA